MPSDDEYDPEAYEDRWTDGPDECQACVDGRCPSCADDEAPLEVAQVLEATLSELHEAYRAVMILAYVFNLDDLDIEDFDPVVDRVLRRADRHRKTTVRVREHDGPAETGNPE